MVQRKVIGGFLLLLGILAWEVSAQVTFVDQGFAAGYLNPGDTDIVVQKVRLQNTSGQPVLFDVITVRNLGTATHQEITRIELWDGGGLIGAVDDPIGLDSGGVAIAVDYTLPAGATVDIEVLVDVADVAQIEGGETLALEVRFHYFVGTTAYTSAWIPDGETEEIVKAGFEEIQETVLPAGNYNPGDGVGNPVQQVTFTDNDANDSPITVTKIKVRNLGTAIAVDDIASVKVTVRYDGVNYEETKVPGATDFNNGGLVFDPTTDFGAWNGNVADDSAIEIKVEIEVAGNPTDGRIVQTEIILELVEQQPGGDQGFTQTSQAPTVQTIRNAGVEEIEEQSTVPASGVLNPGEILTQTIVIRDADVNADPLEVTRIWIQNQGSAGDGEIADIKVKVNGAVINTFNAFAGFVTTGVWLDIADQQLDDDGELTLQILYRIGNITPGHTLQPRVKIGSHEPPQVGDNDTATYVTDAVDFPMAVELRPAGFEYAEDVAQDSATVFTGQRFLAQKIRLDDQDENDDGATINPVVIKNLGTAKASDITKIEVRNAAGDLLGETTDVAGFGTGGVTISTLQNNAVADDGSTELWIWVTVAAPEVAAVGRTIKLETTVYHLENGATYQATVASAAVFTIELNRRPVVDFTWNPSEPTWEDTITFNPDVNDPDGDAIVWAQWDFGDGTIIELEAPDDNPLASVTHRYPDGGTFTVTLTVKDARGLEGTKSKQITVEERPNQAPTADFSWTPAEPKPGEEVTFTATAEDPDDPPDTPLTYAWDFGDGTTLDAAEDNQEVTHAYTNPGTYTVTLTVRDARGAETQVEKEITVAEPVNQPPSITSLTLDPEDPVTGQEVTFNATATDPEDDAIVAWQWDFDGDGNVDSTQAPPVTHTYDQEGVYTVRVRATDEGSDTWGPWYERSIYVRRQGGPEIGGYVERNPVSTQAAIVYFLPAGATNVKLSIFDLMGRLVFEANLNPAANTYNWNLQTSGGADVPSGVYFFVITAEKDGRTIRSAVGRILVVR